MPFLQPSIEGSSLPTQDPWDWTVDQVVFALTNGGSSLLNANRTLSLPNASYFAKILYENDVNGLALLNEVKGKTLSDGFRIKSMSHRASINHLIRQLQDSSVKYYENIVKSGRAPSSGMVSRMSTPFFGSPQKHDRQAHPEVSGPWQSPVGPSDQSQNPSWSDGATTGPKGRIALPMRDILAEAPVLPQPDWQKPNVISCVQDLRIIRDDADNKDNKPSATDQGQDAFNVPDDAVVHNGESTTSSDIASVGQHTRPGEVTFIDETGRKRRRLTLASANAPNQVEFGGNEQSPDSPCGLIAHADPVAVTSLTDPNNPFQDLSETSAGALQAPLQAEGKTSSSNDPETTSAPGVVVADKQGRKRLRPILVTPPELPLEPRDHSPRVTESARNGPETSIQSFQDNTAPSLSKQRKFGRKATRTRSQTYLGPEPFSVDELFYGDIPLESKLGNDLTGAEYAIDSDDFIITSSTESSNGLSLYVNARMKHYFQSQRMMLRDGNNECAAIIPYPNRIGRRHYPLSITTFARSPNAISAFRSNRSKWIRDSSATTLANPRQDEATAFNVADPALARDEEDDPEWKALEKWKYMSTEDDVLPVYGESGSEGEYELDTWKEIELERGEVARPLGPSRSQHLTAEEVDEAIATAIKQIVEDWGRKRKPKLQASAWRLWAKSRRDATAKKQMDELTATVETLENRINNLRKGIAEEEWSKSSQISKQCNAMQPSIYDREDKKWKISLLASRKTPEKPAPTARKPKVAKLADNKQALDDDEENLVTDADLSESSDGSLDGFVVQDDSEADDHQPINAEDDNLSMADVEDAVDDNFSMADVQDAIDSETLTEGQDQVMLMEPKVDQKLPSDDQGQVKSEDKAVPPIPSKAPIVDLTLDSDTPEPENSKPESKRTFEIKTPPVNGSENESDAFERSRKKKAVFKKLRVPQDANVINLESDSSENTAAGSPTVAKRFPGLDDVVGISLMDPSILVERQDRKRLLTWIIAHAPAQRRQLASSYLNQNCFEDKQFDTNKALKRLLEHKRRMSGVNNEISDSIMSIASWQVCWTIPVKTDSSGLKTSHIETTLADVDGFESFHEFLLRCLSHCQTAFDPPERITPSKKKRDILQEPDENLDSSPFRKRKYKVTESQETLNKRQAAQDRMRGDEQRRQEEHRRREELASRLKAMGSNADDSQKIVLNPGKLADQAFIYLNPKFGNGVSIKEHQKEGLRFLWREITGEHEDLQGCLLAQTMGLGKTMQVIALLVTLSEASRSAKKKVRRQVPPTLRESRTLILCPPALLENWWDEFLIWAPRPFSNHFGELRKVSVSLKPNERLCEIREWSEKGGVLLVGYDTFKGLIHNRSRKHGNTTLAKAPLDEVEHTEIKEALLNRANLVVADEAHTFKRKTSKVNSAMIQFQTRSRIALSGSPLNNNLEEYYTLIDWIAPNYLGTPTEFKANYEEPIQEGLYQDSTTAQYARSRTRLKALEIEMEPKVHRANVSVLRTDLQGKLEFVVRVPLTKLQEDLYKIFVNAVQMAVSRKEPGQTSLWSWLGILQLLCNHPNCFRDKMLALEAEVQTLTKPSIPIQSRQADASTPEEGLGGSEEDATTVLVEQVTPTAFAQVIEECEEVFQHLNEPSDALSLSNKMQILMKILELSAAAKDKVLVFSHRIATLDYIQKVLEKNQEPFARIDGKMLPQKRQPITKEFNEGNVNICLISTRAGGTGLNLYGANRVVILDEHFNPAFEMQAVGRAYRIGQQKIVYVYRLTAGGTFEQAIQNQALFKEQLADRVVDGKTPRRSALKGAGQYLFPPKPVTQEPLDEFVGKDPLVLDHLLADDIRNQIKSIIPSETLHIEDDMPLTEEMTMEAQKMVKNEQLRRRDPQAHTELIRKRDQAHDELVRKRIQSVQEHARIPNSTPVPAASALASTQPGRLDSSSVFSQSMIPPVSTAPTFPQHMGGLPYDKTTLKNVKPIYNHHYYPGFAAFHSPYGSGTPNSAGAQLRLESGGFGAPSEEPPQMPWSELNLSNPTNLSPSLHTPTLPSGTLANSIRKSDGVAGRRDGPQQVESSNIGPPGDSSSTSAEPDATQIMSGGENLPDSSESSVDIGNDIPSARSGGQGGIKPLEEARRETKRHKNGKGRKHSLPGEQANQTKKRKSAPRVSPSFNSTGPMESGFRQFLDKENTRSSK